MIYKFSGNEVPKVKQVGGKAKALIETTKAGFPVPEGIALSVEFFNSWLTAIKSSEEWQAMLDNTNKENCNLVKNKAMNFKFSADMEKSFKAEMASLQGEVFAVRSSSPEEDLEGTSFAGMYETLLGQRRETLEKAIAEAFSSCFDFRVMSYKKQHGMDIENTSIAVVVQRQIVSDVSGVGFSLNPLNNCYDEVMINASFGLGEAIVSGIVRPDTYIVDSIKNEITEKQVNEKQIGLWLKNDGGIYEKDNHEPKKQALKDEQILELAALIKNCEKHFDMPMDTEWAFEDSKLYLLQSRPITTYLPLFKELVTQPGDKKNLYLDMICMTQGFTESFSVLGLEIWKKLFSELGGFDLPEGMDGITLYYHGRHYFHIPNVLAGLGKMGQYMIYNYDGSVERIINSINLDEYMHNKKLPRVKKAKRNMLKMYLSLAPSLIRASLLDYKKVQAEYLEVTKNARKRFKEELNLNIPFADAIKDALNVLNNVVMQQGAVVAGINAERILKKMFKNQEVESYIAAMGAKVNPTSLMGIHMYRLASYTEVQETKTPEEFARRLSGKEYSKKFIDDYEAYMFEYGSRGYREIDVATTRAYEDPSSFFMRLKDINLVDNKMSSSEERSKEGYNKLLELAKKGGFEKKFRKNAEVYQNLFGYREEKKVMMVLMINKLRKIALAKGEVFVSQGRLDRKEEIFDLTISQIQKAEQHETFNMRNERAKNLEPYDTVRHVRHWPIIIDSRGKIFHAIKKSKEGDLIGDPISQGITRGYAKVMHAPDEKHLEPGEILVTFATEPSWTPIFSNASAVVMEIGGTLQHGAIIAREYGLPCVGGLTGATSMIKDGDMIEVDGTNGIVRILEELQ
ncbi:PEP/pyruvate-binding domain-containing protein [Clostridiaceae bacterium M8S5]|nr:PEP/pyruvate-binding domain-containing protein [Clostridiaceae bacterium M8S5]